MGTEYRHVKCPSCSAKLRIIISEMDYEKTVQITCPICETKCRTTIPEPKVESKHPSEDTLDDLKDLFGFGDLLEKIPKK